MNARTTLSIATILTLCGSAAAGPMTPPAGPVGPTYKTLSEVEPRTAISAANTPGDANSIFRITQPGSYYLTSNVLGAAGMHGIEIAASNVTIDLRGFTVEGVRDSLDGIRTDGNRDRITVHSGVVTGFSGSGIDLEDEGLGQGAVVEGVVVSINGGAGILVGGDSAVRRCSAIGSGSTGIWVTADACIVESCLVHASGAYGIRVLSAGTISGCTVSGSVNTGILAGTGGTVSACVSRQNNGGGFFLNHGTVITGSTARANADTGIACSVGNTVNACAATDNGEHGIDASFSTTVTGCSSARNAHTGIVANSRCLIRANTCEGNGDGLVGSGIFATSQNRIEGNVCTGADFGINVPSSGNFITGNTCSGNTTNWSIFNGNVCLVVQATPAGGINGDSGGVSPGSSNPHANFTY